MQRVASGAFQLYTFAPVQWRELCEAFGPGKVNESSLRQLVLPCKDQLLVDEASFNHKSKAFFAAVLVLDYFVQTPLTGWTLTSDLQLQRKIGHNYVIWKIDENWYVRPTNSHRIRVSESVRAKMQTHRAFVDGKSSSRRAGWHLIEPSVATTLTSHRTKPTQASQAREHASKSGLSRISHLCIPWIIRESNQIPCIILYPDSCQHIAACNGAAASTPFTSPRESCCKASFAAGVPPTTAYKAAETAQRFLPTTLLQTLARLLTKFCGSGLTISILLEER